MIFAAGGEVTQRVEGIATKQHNQAQQSFFFQKRPLHAWGKKLRINIELVLERHFRGW